MCCSVFTTDDPAPLWVLLDEEPHEVCYVTDAGAEMLPGRLAGIEVDLAVETDRGEWIERVLAANDDCRRCEFLSHCGGYFKWPNPDYDCAGVKRLFGGLRDAAAELRRDLAQALPSHSSPS